MYIPAAPVYAAGCSWTLPNFVVIDNEDEE
jgi:hypothetical protein